MSTIELRNAYIVAKEVDTILEMICEGKYQGIDELSTLFADAYLKNKSTIYWLEDEYKKYNKETKNE